MSGSPQSSQATLTQYDRLLAAWSDQSAGVHSKTARLLPNTTNTQQWASANGDPLGLQIRRHPPIAMG